MLFFSPNTEEGLSLEESLRRLTSPGQQRFRRLTGDILRQLAVGPAVVHDAIGDWADGVENSLLVVLPRSPDAVRLRWAAAWFGLAADQKAVLAFRPNPRGVDLLVTLTLPTSLAEARVHLDRHGIRGRTILPHTTGCRILVLDERGSRLDLLSRLAFHLGGRIEVSRGHGVSLAGPTRDEARRCYREVLRSSGLAAARQFLHD